MLLATPIAKIHTRCSGCGCYREIQWQVENRLQCDRCIQILQLKCEVQIPAKTTPATKPAKTKPSHQPTEKKPAKPRTGLRSEIWRIIRQQEKPIGANEIFLSLNPAKFSKSDRQKKSVYSVLKEFESEGLIVAVRQFNRRYIDKEREYLLEQLDSIVIPFESNQQKILKLLEAAAKPLSAPEACRLSGVSRSCTFNTLRLFVVDGWCDSCDWINPVSKCKTEYFALISNELAFAKLQELRQDSLEDRILKSLSSGAKCRAEIARDLGRSRRSTALIGGVLSDLENQGRVRVSHKVYVINNWVSYYELAQRMEA